ncbi:MAG: ROK family protein [Candidatus Methanolliviera hydrocarbonicum]|jgi:Transcriptional regulator/sugar kinase|uniref:ROK family protein n=1 Tax=Candidatus Methanolliviera hydrocarbonicum TaxID=2491085 RepID=A0A520KXU0_9EURY|nr:MAG: ROK family protein [Candidatus Methanolliviera hydrocarbonicum]
MILGVDMGGTKTELIVYDGEKFDFLEKFPSNKENLKSLPERVDKLVKSYGIEALGIGVAAWIRKEKIIKAPNLNVDYLNFNFSVPYIMENDANCFAYGEYREHEDEEVKNLIGITIGTGIGGGLIINGEIYRGNGLAGEIAHTTVLSGEKEERCSCGRTGHLETHFSGWSIEKRLGRDVETLMREDEELIYGIEGFEILARSIANLSLILDPDLVVFGGGVGRNLNVDRVKGAVKKYLLPEFEPKILISEEEYVGAKGAALLAQKRFRL